MVTRAFAAAGATDSRQSQNPGAPMVWLRHPLYSILVVVLIGVACGLLARRLSARESDAETFTAICVGLAGAFLGFHFAMLSNLATDQVLVPFIVALVTCALLLW